MTMNYLNYQFTYELPVYTCTTIATLCLLSQAHAVNRKGNSLASRFTGIENPERMRDTELLSWSTARHKIVLFHCYSFEPLIVFIVSYQGVVPKWSCPVTRRYRVYSLPQTAHFPWQDYENILYSGTVNSRRILFAALRLTSKKARLAVHGKHSRCRTILLLCGFLSHDPRVGVLFCLF